MAISKQRKVFASVLAVACGGLVIDRCFGGGGPQSALAQSAAPDAASPPEKPAIIAVPVQGAARPLAARLEEVRSSEPGADPFASPFHAAEEQAIVDAAVPEPPKTPARVSFAENHRVTSIMLGASSFAVVDGKGLRVGGELDGWKLVRIDRQAAVFALDGEEAVLSVR